MCNSAGRARYRAEKTASGALEASGGDGDPLPQDGDVDTELQRSATTDSDSPLTTPVETQAPRRALPADRCIANIIRGPPFLA
ncbi:hypothetical protein [Microbulbifer halophilus]|uniref:Uncharacterized protein n=1 Tax=Microbulbifer halophilus TaxID=453963 RepID=A0ABW5E7V6_9GAMM|nr:hypothetical protein [Microbulbifer halophilus]MCW8126755.1 hypothetical protein [Microbulbifer halophilus]